ncbi:hypothetical protein STEG23_008044, partial [Scotinomys teguina]
ELYLILILIPLSLECGSCHTVYPSMFIHIATAADTISVPCINRTKQLCAK